MAAALCAASAHAATGQADGGQPGAWLAGYTGARTLGLGGAFVATADDALGALWNPAGLPDMDRYELRFENARLFEGTSVNAAAFALPGSRLPSFGLAMVSLRSDDFERTNEMNDALGTFHEGETAYVFTLAKGVTQRLALGVNVKVLQQTVEDFSAAGPRTRCSAAAGSWRSRPIASATPRCNCTPAPSTGSSPAWRCAWG
jgi:hypothetical protein